MSFLVITLIVILIVVIWISVSGKTTKKDRELTCIYDRIRYEDYECEPCTTIKEFDTGDKRMITVNLDRIELTKFSGFSSEKLTSSDSGMSRDVDWEVT